MKIPGLHCRPICKTQGSFRVGHSADVGVLFYVHFGGSCGCKTPGIDLLWFGEARSAIFIYLRRMVWGITLILGYAGYTGWRISAPGALYLWLRRLIGSCDLDGPLRLARMEETKPFRVAHATGHTSLSAFVCTNQMLPSHPVVCYNQAVAEVQR